MINDPFPQSAAVIRADSRDNVHRPIEDLEQGILKLSTRINAATYELLMLVREFDERVGWLRWGLDNCAEWLAWRCDIGLSAAREKVRVAHSLKVLPEIAAAFAAGRLSYSKVRPLTRVARPDNESELLAFALRTTATHVEERCRELRRGRDDSISDAERAHARRSLRIHRDHGRDMINFSLELPIEAGELLEKAIDLARDREAMETKEFADESWAARQADAIVAVANAYLSGGGNGDGDGSASGSDNYLVTVHVDQSALADGDGRSSLPIESVRRLCCDGNTVVLVENEQGEPVSIGRKSRTVPTGMKRALQARDKGCIFPGCHKQRFVDAHHVEHWSAGGETALDNLVLLCTKHHTLVHEGGFTIDRDFQNRWFFRRPDGRALPNCGYHDRDMIDDDIGDFSALFNNPSAEGLLSGLEKPSAQSPPG